MEKKLRYFDDGTHANAISDIRQNTNLYLTEADNQWFLGKYECKESTNVVWNDPAEADPEQRLVFGKASAEEESRNDGENSIRLFKRLSFLKPSQAVQSLFWSAMCHAVLEFYEYTRARWLANLSSEDCKLDDIKRRFFAKNPMRVWDGNALARLWWGAYVSFDENREDKFELTRILWRTNQDWQDFMDTKSCLSRSRAHGVLSALKMRQENQEKYLTDANDFRALNKYLNRRAVVAPLEFFNSEEICSEALAFFEKRKRGLVATGYSVVE